jgi:HEXXH motif-containing protein
LINTHRLPSGALAELAVGHGDRTVVGCLRAAQHSKHLLLLHLLAKEAAGAGARTPALEAFRSGYDLLAKVQAEQPGVVAGLVRLPHVGAWAHDCVVGLDQGRAPDWGYLAVVAATAALRAGAGFDLDVPAADGQVRFPGLGCLNVMPALAGMTARAVPQSGDRAPWVRLSSDGHRLVVDGRFDIPCAALLPDAVAGTPDTAENEPAQWWSGTHRIRATADGRTWDVLLELADANLDRFSFPVVKALTARQLSRWRDHLQAAWEVLARQDIWPLDAFADTVSVVVPITELDDADLVSVTTPAAFGAIATSSPPDPVVMAEVLIHEFQHLKLSAVMDMVPLLAPSGAQVLVYAPWRQDPRPAGGLLQGIYAHLAIVRFWDAQRELEGDPDDRLRAQVMYERWRPTIESAADTLLGMEGCLTPEGVRFARALKGQGHSLEPGPVTARVREMAEEVALDHWLTWQLRHVAVNSAQVAQMAAAFVRGQSPNRENLPAGEVEPYVRQVATTARSRMLNLRHLEPKRFRQLHGAGVTSLSRADGLLIDGEATEAAQAYRQEILTAASPAPQSWVGLAIAAGHQAPPPLREAFATRLPLMFEVHGRLAGQGIRSDPLNLAAWLA